MTSNLELFVGRLLRMGFVVVCICVICQCWIILKAPFLEPSDRLLVMMVGAVASLLFILAHAIYEARAGIPCLSTRFAVQSVASIIALNLPSAFLVLRHLWVPIEYVSIANGIAISVLFLLLVVIPTSGLGSDESLASRLTAHIKSIMWDSWRNPRLYTDVMPGLDRRKLREKRRRFYVDRQCLRTFQKTLSTPECDAETAARLIGEVWCNAQKPKTSIRVLDIGGGDGKFTRFLLNHLSHLGIIVDSITVVDPVDWKEEYCENVAAIGQSADRISFKIGKVEEFNSGAEYDLVIASHSLYGSVDSKAESKAFASSAVVSRVLKWRRTGGIAVICLASRIGRSYRFKAEALRFLFGEPFEDVVAEDFLGLSELAHASLERVDNIMDLTTAVTQAEENNFAELDRFLSYFLRVPMIEGRIASEEVRRILLGYVTPLEELGEQECQRFAHLSWAPSPSNMVLPHKVVVWVVAQS